MWHLKNHWLSNPKYLSTRSYFGEVTSTYRILGKKYGYMSAGKYVHPIGEIADDGNVYVYNRYAKFDDVDSHLMCKFGEVLCVGGQRIQKIAIHRVGRRKEWELKFRKGANGDVHTMRGSDIPGVRYRYMSDLRYYLKRQQETGRAYAEICSFDEYLERNYGTFIGEEFVDARYDYVKNACMKKGG